MRRRSLEVRELDEVPERIAAEEPRPADERRRVGHVVTFVVAAALLRHPAVDACTVTVDGDDLMAFVAEPQGGSAVDLLDKIADLQRSVPEAQVEEQVSAAATRPTAAVAAAATAPPAYRPEATGIFALPRFLEMMAAIGEVTPTVNANGRAAAPASSGV